MTRHQLGFLIFFWSVHLFSSFSGASFYQFLPSFLGDRECYQCYAFLCRIKQYSDIIFFQSFETTMSSESTLRTQVVPVSFLKANTVPHKD